MHKEKVEFLLEKILSEILLENVSVCIFGKEVSVNINGKIYHFAVDEEGQI